MITEEMIRERISVINGDIEKITKDISDAEKKKTESIGLLNALTGDRVILEDVIASYGDNDTEAGIKLENEFGFVLEEAGGGMAADLTLTADADASFTVN